MGPFFNQVVIITGAASGIGRELARRLHADGARIGALDLNSEGLAQLAEEFNQERIATAVTDVTRLEDLKRAVKALEDDLGGTDILIASAGIGFATPAEDFSPLDISALIEVNLVGVVNSIGAVLPGMQQRRKGHLVALSSLASQRGFPHMAGYCASKAGLNAVMDSLRLELRSYNIHVTILCPGWIQTPMTDAINVPQPEMMELTTAARRMIHAIRKRKPYALFPRRASWLLRFLSWLPTSWSDRLLMRKWRKLAEK